MQGQPFKRESNLSSRGQQQKSVFLASRPAAEEELPECYFHRENRITKFCECKECTLPLCSTCEEIHLDEHEGRKVKAQINGYSAVRDKAMKDLPQLIRRYRQIKEVATQVIHNQYDQLVQLVNSYYEHLLKEIDALTVSDQKLAEYEQRHDKISKGSIKSLIQHYSDSYPQAKQPKLNINFSPAALSSLLKSMASVESQPDRTKLGSPMLREQSDMPRLSEQPLPMNESKRLEYSPKLALTKSYGGAGHGSEEELSQFPAPFERPPPEYLSPIDKLTGESKKQQESSPFKTLPEQNFPVSRKPTMDLLDPNTINRKKYEEIRDSFRRNNTLMMGSNNSINRSNAASLEAKDWKKVINTVSSNQGSTGNILPPANYQSTNVRKDTLQPVTDQHQRSPSFTTTPNPNPILNPKPKTNPCSNPTNPSGKQLTHEQINDLISKREELSKEMDKTRNKSVDIKKNELGGKVDLGDRFVVKQQESLVNRSQIQRKQAPDYVLQQPTSSAGRYLAQYSSATQKALGEQQSIGPSPVVSSLINSSSNQQQLDQVGVANSFIRREQAYIKRYDAIGGQQTSNPNNSSASNAIVQQALRSGRGKEEQGKVTTQPFEYRYVASKQPPNH